MTVFRSIQGKSSFVLWAYRSISEKTLTVEYPGYTGDHSIVYHFQPKHAVLVKRCAKSAGVKRQESHFYQYRVMTKACQLNSI